MVFSTSFVILRELDEGSLSFIVAMFNMLVCLWLSLVLLISDDDDDDNEDEEEEVEGEEEVGLDYLVKGDIEVSVPSWTYVCQCSHAHYMSDLLNLDIG